MQDTEKANRISWDDKLQGILWQLQDYQEAKDHPQAQVVNMEVEDLCVSLRRYSAPITDVRTLSFKQRFKSLIEQYELRELHFHSLLRTKELEVQYNMARFEDKRKAAEAEVTRSRALSTLR